MSTQTAIENKLSTAFNPLHLKVDNESHMHSGPATESHFKVTLVSDSFSSLTRVKRHQEVYAILADELAGSVHALALHLYTPDEWDADKVPDSPNCRGGSKVESQELS
ncbi:MAG: BolA/IbaG family iron-sulfur metabolism protein [Proteobacteria bacterium]|nr:BolA/IbaG family iron-sulfur metabolism protein [Pseudomonadota bacterium]MDA0929246.1 BolA/IbaG family iron-sulfur metabolism protein [Pseudomonadota bacterium]